MNKRLRTAVLGAVGAAAAMASHSAMAQTFAQGDLLLGFNGNGAASDYVINVGTGANIGVGGTSQVNLSSDFSLTTFNSVFTAGANGVSVGLGGGVQSLNPTVFVTQQRVGGPGASASVAGSTTPGAQTTSNGSARAGFFNTIGGAYSGLATVGGFATPAVSDTTSWTSKITASSGSSLNAQQAFNDVTPISGSQVFEDLYEGVKSGTSVVYTYEGYLTLDLTGSTPSLNFTPSGFVPVPEPATYGWIAGAGLLALSLRRQFKGKLA